MTPENFGKSEYYESLIHQARQTDLVAWLQRNGVKLRRVGQWHTIEGHDSYRIQGNMWYRNSTGKSGNSIDFVCYYYGISAKQAIIALTGVDLADRSKPIKPILKPKTDGVKENNAKPRPEDTAQVLDFSEIKLNHDQRRVIAYLTKKRGIAAAVVIKEISGKRLFQEAATGNAIFAMLDENGAIVGGECNGTLSYEDTRFKQILTASKRGYGYNTGERNNPRYMLFFESAVDLLSFITLEHERGKTLAGCLLVSMAGLKPAVISQMLEVFGGAAVPVLCVDNDKAGRDFIDRTLKKYPAAMINQPHDEYKNWNEQLVKEK